MTNQGLIREPEVLTTKSGLEEPPSTSSMLIESDYVTMTCPIRTDP